MHRHIHIGVAWTARWRPRLASHSLVGVDLLRDLVINVRDEAQTRRSSTLGQIILLLVVRSTVVGVFMFPLLR